MKAMITYRVFLLTWKHGEEDVNHIYLVQNTKFPDLDRKQFIYSAWTFQAKLI